MLKALLLFANTGLFITVGVIVGIGLILLLWVVALYNGLVGARNRYKNAFAQIDVQLKRRHDLIPNLVETAKGYMQHAARWRPSSPHGTPPAPPARRLLPIPPTPRPWRNSTPQSLDSARS
jgi:LemA family